ncbi:hypothetical protein AB1Y20_006174 [Prymnesium parvum]|uniref:Inositol phosphatase domain-containing protein n=1 Tax=Prymnesium parvum TaxID=97485 RepID=A0AB34J571_PRYPA
MAEESNHTEQAADHGAANSAAPPIEEPAVPPTDEAVTVAAEAAVVLPNETALVALPSEDGVLLITKETALPRTEETVPLGADEMASPLTEEVVLPPPAEEAAHLPFNVVGALHSQAVVGLLSEGEVTPRSQEAVGDLIEEVAPLAEEVLPPLSQEVAAPPEGLGSPTHAVVGSLTEEGVDSLTEEGVDSFTEEGVGSLTEEGVDSFTEEGVGSRTEEVVGSRTEEGVEADGTPSTAGRGTASNSSALDGAVAPPSDLLGELPARPLEPAPLFPDALAPSPSPFATDVTPTDAIAPPSPARAPPSPPPWADPLSPRGSPGMRREGNGGAAHEAAAAAPAASDAAAPAQRAAATGGSSEEASVGAGEMRTVELEPAAPREAAEAGHDVVLSRRSRRESAPATVLRSAAAALERVGSVAELAALLEEHGTQLLIAGNAESVRRSVQYVSGLVRKGEGTLCGWPVVSCNEWGMQQPRVLVLTSQSLYRVAFVAQNGTVDHYSRTSLAAIKRIERGRQAFRVCVTEPDGRENPLTYFWTEYVQKGTPRDNRFERVYYPSVSSEVPTHAAIEFILHTIKAANRILCNKVGESLHVSELEIVDSQPEESIIEEVVGSTTRGIEQLSKGIIGAWQATFVQRSSSRS